MPFLTFCQIQKRALWRLSIELDAFTIGGSREATVTIADPRLAAEEVAIRREGEEFRLASLSEDSDVRLNGAVVKEGTIATGDRLRLGDTLLIFDAETHPSDDRIERLTSILEREVCSPAVVEEALHTANATWHGNWRVTLAFAMCGLAVGVLTAIIIARIFAS